MGPLLCGTELVYKDSRLGVHTKSPWFGLQAQEAAPSKGLRHDLPCLQGRAVQGSWDYGCTTVDGRNSA